MTAPEDRVVALAGGDAIRIREWGTGPTPLLLVHGFMGGCREWGDLPAQLGDCRVVAVDLPGHGESGGGTDPDRYRIPRVAQELDRLQERVFGGPAAWLGYSMGGRIALSAAVLGVPMRSLLLEGASPGLRAEEERRTRREQDEERARRLERQGMARFVDEWFDLPLFEGLRRLPDPILDQARRVRQAQDPSRMAAWLRGGGVGCQPSYWDDLPSLRLPVRILVGARDHKFRGIAREMAALLPDARVTVTPGAGHLPHLERPEAWLDWVRTALAGAA